jgi:ABC-type transporter Mla subunit MlaD
MAPDPQQEQRLAAVEKAVAELRSHLNDLTALAAAVEGAVAELRKSLQTPAANWIEQLSGSMKDFPEFEEVVRLGREFREADRPPEEGEEQP